MIFIAVCVSSEDVKREIIKGIEGCQKEVLIPIFYDVMNRVFNNYPIVIVDNYHFRKLEMTHACVINVDDLNSVEPPLHSHIYTSLIDYIRTKKPWHDDILVDGRYCCTLRFDEIEYIETYDRKIAVVTGDHTYYSRRSFKQWLSILNDSRFVECYRGIAVNLDHVKHVSSSLLYLQSGQRIPLSRRRYQHVWRIMNRRKCLIHNCGELT